jgi:glycosyltransferase involved in cell wall biosynthesis
MDKVILLVSNVYPPKIIGGAEVIAHHQAREFQRAGYTVHVFAGEGGDRERYSVSSDIYEGIPIERIHLNWQDYSLDYLNFVHPEVDRCFTKLLDRIQPSIVHLHNPIGMSLGIPAIAARRRIPVVLTLHDHWGFCMKNTIVKRDNELCRNFSRCSECQERISDGRGLNAPIRMRNDYLKLQLQYISAFISPSEYLAAAYAKASFPTERLYVIRNGIDVSRFSSVVKKPRSGKLRFTIIGNIGEHKGVRVLIEALRLIRHKLFYLNVVGSGELCPELEMQIDLLGLEEQARFWGMVKHDVIEQVYEETDVQLMPSIWPENQPVSITESMASRTAVIAANIGGIPELVEHGKTGYLFEPGDAAQLAARMLDLIMHPDLAEEMGRAGFERIRHASFERQAGRILKLYERGRPVGSVQSSRPLVVCCGPRLDDRAFKAIAEIELRCGRDRHRFVMHDWLSADQLRMASVALVLPGAGMPEVLKLMRLKIPIVVPLEMPELVELCRKYASGFYYETNQEAAEYVLWLLANAHDRKLLGDNACRASFGERS